MVEQGMGEGFVWSKAYIKKSPQFSSMATVTVGLPHSMIHDQITLQALARDQSGREGWGEEASLLELRERRREERQVHDQQLTFQP